jgi:hypothetical protein
MKELFAKTINIIVDKLWWVVILIPTLDYVFGFNVRDIYPPYSKYITHSILLTYSISVLIQMFYIKKESNNN